MKKPSREWPSAYALFIKISSMQAYEILEVSFFIHEPVGQKHFNAIIYNAAMEILMLFLPNNSMRYYL